MNNNSLGTKLFLPALSFLLLCGFLSGFLSGCKKDSPLTENQKASYVLGQNIGKSIKAQVDELDLKTFVAGLSDAVEGKNSKLTPEEAMAAMAYLQKAAKIGAEKAGEINLREGEAYLEKNKSNEGWQVTSTGLQYKIIKEGQGTAPAENDKVKLSYTGTLINGQKFESSASRGQPLELPVAQAMPGWKEALKMMKPGSEIQLAVPAQLAYGKQGHGIVGPNSTVLFDLSLVSVETAAAISGADKASRKTGRSRSASM